MAVPPRRAKPPAVRTLGSALQPLAPMLQAVAPMLEPLALPLPRLPLVLVPPALQSLAVALPTPASPLHPIAVPLQTLASTLEPPPLLPVMTSVPGMPALGGRLALDGEGAGGADLRGQRRNREAQRRQGERVVSTYHEILPAAGPRGATWRRQTGWNGRKTRREPER